jgi:hypothetical protein
VTETVAALTITPHATHVRVEADLDGEGGELVAKAVDLAVDRLDLPTDLPYARRRALGLVAVSPGARRRAA